MLDATLANRPWVLGNAFGVADAADYHTLWFVRSDPASAQTIRSRAYLAAWFDRVEAMGSGRPRPMGRDEAIAVARSAEPADIRTFVANDPSGLSAGRRVGICSDDLPTDVFVGELVLLREHEMAIAIENPDFGRVAVHFPRAGYHVREV